MNAIDLETAVSTRLSRDNYLSLVSYSGYAQADISPSYAYMLYVFTIVSLTSTDHKICWRHVPQQVYFVSPTVFYFPFSHITLYLYLYYFCSS